MTSKTSTAAPSKTKRRAIWSGASLIVVAILGLAIWPLIGGPAIFESRTISELMKSAKFIHPVEDTVHVCRDFGCVEGWKSSVGNFLRFKSTGQAQYWETILGDGCRRDGEILVDFSALNLGINQKKDAVDVLFSRKDWY